MIGVDVIESVSKPSKPLQRFIVIYDGDKSLNKMFNKTLETFIEQYPEEMEKFKINDKISKENINFTVYVKLPNQKEESLYCLPSNSTVSAKEVLNKFDKLYIILNSKTKSKKKTKLNVSISEEVKEIPKSKNKSRSNSVSSKKSEEIKKKTNSKEKEPLPLEKRTKKEITEFMFENFSDEVFTTLSIMKSMGVNYYAKKTKQFLLELIQKCEDVKSGKISISKPVVETEKPKKTKSKSKNKETENSEETETNKATEKKEDKVFGKKKKKEIADYLFEHFSEEVLVKAGMMAKMGPEHYYKKSKDVLLEYVKKCQQIIAEDSSDESSLEDEEDDNSTVSQESEAEKEEVEKEDNSSEEEDDATVKQLDFNQPKTPKDSMKTVFQTPQVEVEEKKKKKKDKKRKSTTLMTKSAKKKKKDKEKEKLKEKSTKKKQKPYQMEYTPIPPPDL